jgi:hypothetical protein
MRSTSDTCRRVAGCLLGVLLAGSAGCRGFTPPKLVPVRGKVLYGDRPLADVGVQFNPVDAKQKDNVGNGVTDDKGEFTLTTYYPKAGQLPGAAAGTYKVILVPYPGGVSVPEQYRDPERTPWQVEVGEAGRQDLVLTVR